MNLPAGPVGEIRTGTEPTHRGHGPSSAELRTLTDAIHIPPMALIMSKITNEEIRVNQPIENSDEHGPLALASTGEETVSDRSRFAIFRFAEGFSAPMSTGLPIADASSPEIGAAFRRLIEAGLDDGGTGKVLFSFGDDDEGFCLMYLWLKPHMVIPRHLHGQDCLYLIISGEAVLGSQRLAAGDGFYVPANTPYAYHAGGEGVEVLEFRHVPATGINGIFLDSKSGPWDRFLDVVKTNRGTWQNQDVPPIERNQPATDTVLSR